MLTTYFQRNLDLLVGLLILGISTTVATSAFRDLQEFEKPNNVIFSRIESGESQTEILSKGRCVGSFKTSLQNSGHPWLKLTGQIHTKIGSIATDQNISADLIFNPLNQLTQSNLVISWAGVTLQVETTDVTPIQIVGKFATPGNNRKTTYSLPGPVLLKSNQDGSKRIEYSEFRAGPPALIGAFAGSIGQELDLSLHTLPTTIDSATTSSRCDPSNQSLLDLTALAERLNSQANQLKNLLFLPGVGS